MLITLNKYILVTLLTEWLELSDFVALDSAVCNSKTRPILASLNMSYSDRLGLPLFSAHSEMPLSPEMFLWCSVRGFNASLVHGTTFILSGSLLSPKFLAKAFLDQCKDINALRIVECCVESEAMLAEIVSHCGGLEQFSFGCKVIPNTPDSDVGALVLEQVGATCRGLKFFEFNTGTNISEDCFIDVIRQCHQINEFAISRFHNKTTRTMRALVVYGRAVTKINVCYSDKISISDMALISHHWGCPVESCYYFSRCDVSFRWFLWCQGSRLTRLSIEGVMDVSSLSALPLTSPHLTAIDLIIPQVTNEAVISLSTHIPLLREFRMEMEGARLSPVCVCALFAHCHNLTSLLLDGDTHSNMSLDALTQHSIVCTQLRELCLAFFVLSDAVFVHIVSSCRQLTSLDVRLQGAVQRCSEESISDEAIAAVAPHLGNLTYLNLTACTQLTSAALHSLAGHCTQLRELCVSDCYLMTQEGLIAVLAANGRLTSLRAEEVQLSSPFFDYLCEYFPYLVCLDVRGCAGVDLSMVLRVAAACRLMTNLFTSVDLAGVVVGGVEEARGRGYKKLAIRNY